MFNSNLNLNSHLGATVIRGDGSHRDIANLSTNRFDWKTAIAKLKEPMTFWQRLHFVAKQHNLIPVGLTVAGFAASILSGDATAAQMALVTTAGINYMAADFLTASSNRINAFKYVDCGTGTTAAATSDTALQTPYGGSRTTGTVTNPTSSSFAVAGTVNFTSTLAITEFGLFSASTSGTLWDHRIFSAINVANSDSINFVYTCSLTAGGS